MGRNDERITTMEKVLCILLSVCIIFGNVINSGDFRIAGMVLNLYRMGIPLITAYYFVKRWQKGEIKAYVSNKPFLVYAIIFAFWIVYGCVLLFVSKYVVLSEGLKELLELFLGMLSIYCITECCNSKACLRYFVKIIKIMVCGLCLWGLVEMLTGIHFSGSKYVVYDTISLSTILSVIKMPGFAPITTIFYGINDSAAFMAIFFPLFFIDKEMDKKKRIRNLAMMLLSAVLMVIGDATIAVCAVLVSVVVMLILRGINRYSIGTMSGIVLVQLWAAKWIGAGILWLKKCLGRLYHGQGVGDNTALMEQMTQVNGASEMAEAAGAPVVTISKVTSTSEAIITQIQTALAGYGSLYVRVMITIDALEMWISSYLLGVGPGAFTNYLMQHGARSEIVNPHNLWLEILSQYGIFVFVGYVGLLLYLFRKLVRSYRTNRDFLFVQIICMMVVYVLASMAPSSFLGYAYQWVVLGLGLAALNVFQKNSRIKGR